ncbi:hypothetical protein POX_d06064 [Penicillium oxalicum]|uniref:Uncharacterized protein n=1 Tax=Penicillium oxalicum (strain 114-2 / CGMCC 5302) TaxID=933388 RepID=S8AZ75_PENO1|nr:hypothetical protein POX_d06064 [Penicillium oxalicum]EPS31743.1 hypothetical protein PDE_06700 [Penicillium oxalicum 114-2]KAI2790546.1 hypothetical protein POX_d06064 [Penicillium oxalicum]
MNLFLPWSGPSTVIIIAISMSSAPAPDTLNQNEPQATMHPAYGAKKRKTEEHAPHPTGLCSLDIVLKPRCKTSAPTMIEEMQSPTL